MNEKFYTLPEQKQKKIINAAMEVFGQNEYKRASTDLIAVKAEISKGLLFYYFHNKKELYLFVYNYLLKVMKEMAGEPSFRDISDFFDLLKYFSKRKIRLLKENPYIIEFSMRAFYSEREDVSEALKDQNAAERNKLYQGYFGHVDMSKFRTGVDPFQIFKMLSWMADGYLHERQMQGRDWDVDELWAEFEIWMEIMKRMVYRT